MVSHIVFTDLDGTLLDTQSYSWAQARHAIDQLDGLRIPWILVTSKTLAEVEPLRSALGHTHPFIVENGAAAYIPETALPNAKERGAVSRDGYLVLEWGLPYSKLIKGLQEASESTQCRIEGFHSMTVEAIAAQCSLSSEQAVLAKRREYDEPFRILDTRRKLPLLRAIEEQGLCWTRGGRFWHAFGWRAGAKESFAGKGAAVKALLDLYESSFGPAISIGLGDGWNDVSFLRIVNHPVLIQSPQASALQAQLPGALVTRAAGPEGWAEAIGQLL